MKQFGRILGFELTGFFKEKGFIIFNTIIVILLVGVMFFPRFLSMFGNKEAKSSDKNKIMLIKTDDTVNEDIIKDAFEKDFSNYDVKITNDSVDVIKEKIVNKDVKCAFVINEPTKYTYYINNLSMSDGNSSVVEKTLSRIYQMNVMVERGLSIEQSQDVMNTKISGDVEILGKDQGESFWYAYIMVFVLYFTIIMYGQVIASNVATEKSSRTMELLITCVKPNNMLFGKIIANCIIGMSQLFIVFGSTFVAYNLNESYWAHNMFVKSVFNIPLHLLGYMLLFFVLGFLIYAFLFGAMGSTVSKLEDVGRAIMPITWAIMISFFIAIISMVNGKMDSTLVKICSFIPFTSPMVMFARICMDNVMWYEIGVSIVILIVSSIGIGVLSAKIYRVGVLLYGNKPTIKNVFKLLCR